MSIKSVHQYAGELMEDYPKLTEFEILKLAIEIQRNEIFRAGLNVSSTDSHPSALEALAMAVGYNEGSVVRALEDIASK